ncbi:MAG: peroxiredoxin [Hyphomicrobiales bacterium]|nr:peroxiredoxin [Hyphomicrobiales bacterium]PCJ88810.1 MAG: peroxiredoxin [Hyphomicrobiales bacterium]
MTVSVGDTLPDATFFVLNDDGLAKLTSKELFAGKTVVLFALPGAFTPTCSQSHLPGYLEHLETIKAKGVDDIAVLSVNDAHVMRAWAAQSGGKGKIHFLADPAAEFTTAIGMDIDRTEVGMGIRSQRYSMIVKDGKVTSFNLEEIPGQAVVSGAAAILEQL